jgi:hypothetical protein
MIKKISHIEACEYTYGTKEEREEHIKLMEKKGWREDEGRVRILKPEVSIYDAKEDDHVWYARFTINKMN